ncbi:hypothetical protein LuPra_04934 [Luteitalea pratensis]|uniref:Uncharacterized protein n=1 Tax=Luteitalea pratensis TaxID=1855912 RepID=A0A143PTL4_LUTPR|nr:hypothetical protein LuPra_04934 [Luteitalea pratensis]
MTAFVNRPSAFAGPWPAQSKLDAYNLSLALALQPLTLLFGVERSTFRVFT